jgi:hypothetical protein
MPSERSAPGVPGATEAEDRVCAGGHLDVTGPPSRPAPSPHCDAAKLAPDPRNLGSYLAASAGRRDYGVSLRAALELGGQIHVRRRGGGWFQPPLDAPSALHPLINGVASRLRPGDPIVIALRRRACTIEEAAQSLGWSQRDVRRHLSEGRIGGLNVGGVWFPAIAHVERLRAAGASP